MSYFLYFYNEKRKKNENVSVKKERLAGFVHLSNIQKEIYSRSVINYNLMHGVHIKLAKLLYNNSNWSISENQQMSNIIEIRHRNQIEQKIEGKNKLKPNKLINLYVGSLKYCTAKPIQWDNAKLNSIQHIRTDTVHTAHALNNKTS